MSSLSNAANVCLLQIREAKQEIEANADDAGLTPYVFKTPNGDHPYHALLIAESNCLRVISEERSARIRK